jgi:cytochrome c553
MRWQSAWASWVIVSAFAMGFVQTAEAQTARVQGIIKQAMQLTPRTADGEKIYVQHCASCHGRNAQGDPKTVTPALAGQVSSYLIKQLADMGDADRVVAEMHRLMARPDLGAPQALRDLATYLGGLPRLRTPETGDGRRLVVGERIYRRVCRDCHGASGQGDFPKMIPALRGQHFSYLRMQTRQMALGHRYSVDVEVIELLEALTLDELSAVSDYASRLKYADADDAIALAAYGVSLSR